MEAGRFDGGETQEATEEPMRLPLVGDQHFLLEPTKTGVDIGGLLMEVADNPSRMDTSAAHC